MFFYVSNAQTNSKKNQLLQNYFLISISFFSNISLIRSLQHTCYLLSAPGGGGAQNQGNDENFLQFVLNSPPTHFLKRIWLHETTRDVLEEGGEPMAWWSPAYKPKHGLLVGEEGKHPRVNIIVCNRDFLIFSFIVVQHTPRLGR